VMVANKHNIPQQFSEETRKQVESLSFEIPDDPHRKDLRKLTCFTIDPENARDYDDAVSIERDGDGNYRLGVHIADVSHYVPFNTALDHDALQRGTSVYFTDFVVHMLPEKLSTDLCSLMPGTDRLSMSILMSVDHSGKTLSYEITPSVIHSRRCFSYEEVQNVLDAKKGPFIEELTLLSRLATILQKKRHKEGSIDFDLPEPVYELDENGIPRDIRVRDRLWSHHIVEECMLLANQNVAAYARSRGTKVPFIYRIHDIPEADDIYEWFALMDAFGVQVSFFGLPVTSKKFQKALEKVMKQNKSSYVMRTALRTMTKAKYSVKPVGHFGLAFEDYTHFTSPIRRYPDLMVHRLLKYYIQNKPLDPELKQRLKPIAKSCSESELRALQAEREYHKIKQMRYISEHIGSEFEGTISGVAAHGFWVELDKIFVEGFVHKDTLPKDIWDYDKRHHTLKGFHSKMHFQMGHAVRIRVLKADITNARADFALANSTDSADSF
jgi:ribonuclease R